MNTAALDFLVINTRTGNPIAAFMLPGDAAAFAAFRQAQEGPNGCTYEIVNADGSSTVGEYKRNAFVTWADGRQFVAVARSA
jgi:hypothetical protein